MARPESQQIAGYFATPENLLPHIASLVRWPVNPREHTYLLDPCAGEGTAILALRQLWRLQAQIPAEGRWGGEPDNLPAVYAAELEAGRAETIRDRLLDGDQLFAGDALTLTPFPKTSARATVLFLNPPYDVEASMGRLEHRFLDHFTPFLHPGAGVLLFVVPAAGLAASAGCLARHYLDLQAFRFPDPDYAAFGQIVVVGRRARVSGPPLLEEAIRAWAADPESLPVLEESCTSPLDLDLANTFLIDFNSCPLDVQAAQAAFEPWLAAPVGQDGPVLDLFGATLDAAFPPKPTHLALALSVGLFNGHHLDANDPLRYPRIVAKGVLDRELLTIGERRNSDGDVTATVELEIPNLSLTALDLEQGVFHALAHGVTPTHDTDLARWNAADLLTLYDRSLTARLTHQIRPLHDPRDSARRIALPDLARKPFAIQREAIEAAIKLLAAGRHPFLLAEVGTGKSTMALSIAAALTPAHHAQTRAELRRTGYAADRLPRVRRLLILCPPHLLSTWQEEATAVLPGARVHLLRKPADFAVDAEIFVMSREDAKLGHPWIGTSGPCPRCGASVAETPEERATRRLSCQASLRRPANDSARLALDLATILASVRAHNPVVHRLAPERVLAHYRNRSDEDRALAQAPLAAFFDRALAVFLDHLRDQWDDESVMAPLANHLVLLARLAHRTEALTAAVKRRGAIETDATALSNLSYAEPPTYETAPPYRPTDRLVSFLEVLEERATWSDDRPCGEFLFQAEPAPRRVPLARFLRRYHPRKFDLLVLDEAHEAGNADSAQSKAALRLTTLPGIATIVLSGSLMGGYASSLFPLFWALSRKMREQFQRSDVAAFTARYGYRKLLTKTKNREVRHGRMSDREIGRPVVLGEAPGILPTFLLQHLLPTSIVVHKSELDAELPPIAELPVLLRPETETDRELLDAYRELAAELVDRIKAARRTGASGRFLGALSELPSFLDRATDDLPPFLLRDPLSGEAIAPPPVFSAEWRTPKERWLLETVARHVAAGERVLIYLRHTGGGELPGRLLRILAEIAPNAAFLDVKKVPAASRKDWIDRQVLAKNVPVLLVHPNAVRTGLNNLVAFTVGIWYELDASATTYRQANGRLHRIGQTRPVTIYIPCYATTTQQTLLDLLGRKVGASLQVDGLDLQAALEAAGAGDGNARSAALASAMGMGQAIWNAMAR